MNNEDVRTNARKHGVMTRWTSLVVASVLATVVTGIALGSAGQSVAEDPDRAEVRAVAPDLPRLIPAFDRSQAQSDRIPANARFQHQVGVDLVEGEDRSLSRHLVGARGNEAYVWPMNDGVCHQSAFTAGCAPTQLLAERGVIVGSSFGSETKEVHVFGLAKEGITSVTFDLVDGREVTVAAEDNVVQLDGTIDPIEARWTNPDGSTGVQSGLIPRPTP